LTGDRYQASARVAHRTAICFCGRHLRCAPGPGPPTRAPTPIRCSSSACESSRAVRPLPSKTVGPPQPVMQPGDHNRPVGPPEALGQALVQASKPARQLFRWGRHMPPPPSRVLAATVRAALRSAVRCRAPPRNAGPRAVTRGSSDGYRATIWVRRRTMFVVALSRRLPDRLSR
jgi:hypothetical protein